jgi:di/tricarboxylate transporter
MSLAIISLILLMFAVVVSCISERNVGVMCMAFAFLLATFAGKAVTVASLATFFPMKLFLILVGATMLFSMAANNGTVAKIAKYAVKASGGSVGMIPIIFFILPLVLSAIGPGNIATTVVLAPIGMALAAETRISPFLMTLMIVNGANAGALSPIAPTGIIANGLVEKIKFEYIGTGIFLNTVLGNTLVAIGAYLAFGGLKLWGSKVDPGLAERVKAIVGQQIDPWDRKQIITLIAIVSWIVLVLVFKWDVGYTAMVMAVAVSALGAADEKEAFKTMPWYTTFMLVGVMVMVEVTGKLGGLEYAIAAIAKVSNPSTVVPIFCFMNGFVSTYSGSSAVVMPTFVPLVPGLVAKMGVSGAAAIDMTKNLIYACCFGAHLVDASPLSLLGALCIASAPDWEDKNVLFRNLLIWGIAMAVVAGLLAFVIF